MKKAGLTRAAELERQASVNGPAIEESYEFALRRVRAQLATRTGSDTPLRVTEMRGSDVEGFLRMEEVVSAVLWCSYPVQGSSAVALVALEGDLVALLMGRLFGEGDTQPSLWMPRSPTGVEKAVSLRLCRELMDALTAAWTTTPAPRFLDGKVAPSARIAADLEPTTPVFCTTVEVSSDTAIGRFFVALPMSLLVGLAPEPAGPPPRTPRFDRVLPVEVDLAVELGRLQLPLGFLERLAPGDEINIGIVGEVESRVGGQLAFIGEPGITGGQRCFRVLRRANTDAGSGGGNR